MKQQIILLLALITLYSCDTEFPNTSSASLSKFNSKVFEVSTKNAIIVWDQASDLHSETTQYSIILNDQKVASKLEGVTYSFENLQPKTTYTGIIKAEDQMGKQSVTSFSFKTAGTESIQQASL